MDISYFFAFTTGFLGGFGHCIGMCGPLVTSYAFYECRFRDSRISLLLHILYNSGRVTTYVFIGSLMGFAGSFANTLGMFSGIQNIVTIIAGCIIILMGLGITGIIGGTNFIERYNNIILKAVKMVLEGASLWRYYALGLLIGLVPCGLSYSIFIASAGTGNFFSGSMIALSFGLGTVPALLLFGIIITYLSNKVRGLIYRASGIVIILMGIYFIFRGIGLYADM
ncbi:sulfite exporter TauE/SafE family protein [hot springs metagenome]|uniref:Sulfite exporter TauE/SafE family protein n=1 Tax=hot springs metagenome TaxID=433727 RepID=A0A5J4KYN8_9ZZZZ